MPALFSFLIPASSDFQFHSAISYLY